MLEHRPGERPSQRNPSMKLRHANQAREDHSGSAARKQSKSAPGIGPGQFNPKEYKIVTLRECAPVNERNVCGNPQECWTYWRLNVEKAPWFNPDAECLVALLLDSRRNAKGHALVSIGLLDTILSHPRETFRAAVIGAASAIVLMHNHPSGDPMPSESDISATRQAIEAGKIIGIEVLDHVIIGAGYYLSMRERGLAEWEYLRASLEWKKNNALHRLFAALKTAKTQEARTRLWDRHHAAMNKLEGRSAPVLAKAA